MDPNLIRFSPCICLSIFGRLLGRHGGCHSVLAASCISAWAFSRGGCACSPLDQRFRDARRASCCSRIPTRLMLHVTMASVEILSSSLETPLQQLPRTVCNFRDISRILSTRIKDAGKAIRHSQGYIIFPIPQGLEMGWRGWNRCVPK